MVGSRRCYEAPGAGRDRRRDAEPGPELAAEIIPFVKSRIAPFKAPRVVHFVDDLPRTATGKLVKGELRRRWS